MKNKLKTKTINDLPPNQDLAGIKFKHPQTGETCIYVSQWVKGVWYRKIQGKNNKDLPIDRVFPLFIDDLSEVLKFELA